ncbi:MAG: NAD-dependent epimerase/dehydratase family protein [Pseudomonadota bacterium]|nr:NAD-dependent epimerase/dehydratase family protein [Pseudomonadota bacterium]MEC7091050.1 NAD-dependent epimerase/dehydratase family protein [Pseudomonadota bacterium]MEC7269954.1 NAD-dependent epimerase/dehydratase family protein [Pseudomonadota bacterium]MEC8447952.1 NAD-dependent epimerase/dehydratase family protein [Pseudomonadota bacterium]MEC8453296.1 NAD-dependent epimerase/dehydratase family protein [Pseudomonadota bacterium]
MNKLFCFGVGFTGLQTCEYFNDQKWITSGTTRDRNKKVNPNIELIEYNPNKGKVYLSESLASSKILLISIAPDKNGDVVLKSNYEDIANALKTSVKRVIYLSTTAVYGDANGSTVDEKYKINPQSDRAKSRILAESQWTDLCDKFGVTLNILRLSGIYGTGRNQIRNLINGTAKRIIKEGHVFNRIHVADIARIIYMLSVSDIKSDIFNISDDMPAPPQDVVEFAARLLNTDPPEPVIFSEAILSEMARSFYSETKYIINQKIKEKLGLELKYPNYKLGLKDILKEELNR